MSSYYTYEGNLRDRNKFTSTVNTTFGTRRYFSSLDTEVYFGAEQVDEIVAIDFTISEPKLPIYGFNSFYANRIVSGRRTIQGTFAINFISINYLLNILSRIDDSVLKASYTPPGSDVTLDFESLVYRCEGEDSTGLGIGNNAIFRKMFDITISYGYGKTEGKQTYNSCYQTLVGVQIVDYRQALDTEGNPILDMYSFIAKDIRYIDADASTTTPPAEKEESVQEDPKVEVPSEDVSEPDYIVANKNIKKEMDELNSKCQNGSTPGFIVDPTFNYTPPGHHTGSTPPYLRLTISSRNDNTETFTAVNMTIEDNANGINTTVALKDVKKDSNYGAIYEFRDSMREVGGLLYELYSKDEDYKPKCTIQFLATVNGKGQEIKYTTDLFFDAKL